MNFKLKKGTRLLMGGASMGTHEVELVKDADVDFIGVESQDQLAEVLSMDSSIYANHREDLAHEEEDERDGARVRLFITYGINGTRQEEVISEAGDAQVKEPAKKAKSKK